jgi:hypothetical protein
VIFDSAGNLYGTTQAGGAYGYYGIVFELMPKAGGGWKEKVLHSFNNNGTDGYSPYAGLTFDAAGNLYGTTEAGGASNGRYGLRVETHRRRRLEREGGVQLQGRWHGRLPTQRRSDR